MCGIAGLLTLERPVDAGLVASVLRMMDAQTHRGPDDWGLLVPEGTLENDETRSLLARLDPEHVRTYPGSADPPAAVLGARRLSILDLSLRGRIPMGNQDERIWITYNGEIYNFSQLRRELKGLGYTFHSETDTEVLLHGYEAWGEEVVQNLRGMFAFALWDAQNEKLFLARDPTGIKPIYYYTDNIVFLFSSELRALLESHLVSRRLSPEGLASYLDCGSVQTPWTIIQGVRSLEPGHYMVVEPGVTGLSIEKLPYLGEAFSGTPVQAPDRGRAVELLRELLEESVRLHLASDVPLGVFLSGGIDSSALVALMSTIGADRPKSFSVVFAEREFSESSYSRLVAKKFNTEHQEIRLSEGELPSLLPEALMAMDQPTIDGINTYVISKCVKEAGVTVALSGLGGDELFAGYPSFRRAQRLKAISRLPCAVRKVVSAAGRAAIHGSVSERKFWEMVGSDGSPETAYRISRQLFSPDEARYLMRSRSAPSAGASCDHALNGDPINAVSLCELQGYMANTLLRDTDCMSMAHALEVRVPFLDTKVISFVLGLPGAWKIDSRRPKPLLLDALWDLLPEEIWRRPKMGFTLPFERWMQGRLKPEIEGVLASGASTIAALGIDPGEAARVWRAFAKKPQSVGWTRPWALYVLFRWCELNCVTL